MIICTDDLSPDDDMPGNPACHHVLLSSVIFCFARYRVIFCSVRYHALQAEPFLYFHYPAVSKIHAVSSNLSRGSFLPVRFDLSLPAACKEHHDPIPGS